MKTLVLYVFDQYNQRVEHYIKNAIFLDPDIDFLIINNGSNVEPQTLPDYVIYFKSQNNGYDFGGWSRGLLYNELYKGYDNFIFLNSSVMGPYLPSYFKGKWTDIYLDGLTDSVKLFGSTIYSDVNNPDKCSYVNSYIFALTIESLQYLFYKQIFSLEDSRDNKEIKMSRVILENGWNIGCLMRYYKDVDFRFLASKPSDYKPFLGDIMNVNHFSDKLFNNFYELVFIKGSCFDFNVQGIKI